MSAPRIGALFAGYGGLDLAVSEVYGGHMVWYSEVDKGALKILEHRFPDVPNVGDVTTADWSQVEPVDILTGGSPCQDLSHAGRRAGMTEGTRSNLWVAMREAIAQLRPRLVVWENVRGALSAEATSAVEPCAGCVGERPGLSLRALGRVVGDLSELGYVGQWHGLRAADVGAPHGRWRVFLTATDARDVGRERGSSLVGDGRGETFRRQESRDARYGGPSLLPTPAAYDGERGGAQHPDKRAAGGHSVTLQDAVHGLASMDIARDAPERDGGQKSDTSTLLPTPRATDGSKGGPNQRGSSGDLMLPSAVALLPTPSTQDGAHRPGNVDNRLEQGRQVMLSHAIGALLPTPAVNDMGEGKTVERWDEWTADMQERHGNGNGHGKSLAIEAQRLLPTPRASDGPDPSSHARSWSTTDNNLHTVVKRGEIGYVSATEGGPAEEVCDLRDASDAQEVCERPPRGSDGFPQAEALLSDLWEHEAGGDEGRAALAGQAAQGGGLPGLRHDRTAARSSRGQESGEQQPGESDDALRELPPTAALAGGPRCTHGCGEACGGHSAVPWGSYEAAIRRWEVRLGRPAPGPTRLSAKGNPQLAAEFCEWLMGLPAGWVTDVPGITRNEALKALGNGVVPQQAAAALRLMAAQAVAA